MSKMIQPNQLDQATKELSKEVKLGQVNVPSAILEQGSDTHYHCVCVKSRDSQDGYSKVYIGKVKVVHQNQWRKMQRQVKDKVFKSQFAGIYDKIVILHNPTIKAKVKALSNITKGDIKKLNEEGKNSKDIAEALKADITLVRAYINKLNK